MLKKFIGHILLLPYNILCFLIGTVFVVIGGWTGRFDGQGLAESIYRKKNSTGLFIFIQILVFIVSMQSAKLAGVGISVLFLSISVIGKYLLSNRETSFYQSPSNSEYQLNYSSNSNNANNYQQQNQYHQQNRNDEEHRRQDAERERQQREQQAYYERQQRESQQRHEEQMRRDEESRRRQREEEQQRNEANRKNWGSF